MKDLSKPFFRANFDRGSGGIERGFSDHVGWRRWAKVLTVLEARGRMGRYTSTLILSQLSPVCNIQSCGAPRQWNCSRTRWQERHRQDLNTTRRAGLYPGHHYFSKHGLRTFYQTLRQDTSHILVSSNSSLSMSIGKSHQLCSPA